MSKGMKTAKVNKIFLVMVLLFLSGCSPISTTEIDSEVVESESTNGELTVYELTNYDRSEFTDDAKEIDLSTTGDIVNISAGGTYALSGSMEGNIVIDTIDENVHLIFNNISVKSQTGPAFISLSESKIVITLLQGTENTFVDAGGYNSKSDTDACLYSKGDITINGSGKLNINAVYGEGLHSGDVVKVVDSNIYIQSKGNAIHGNDGICIINAKLELETEKNGIRTTKTGSEHEGIIEMKDSEVSVIAGKHGILTPTDIYLVDTSLSIKSVYDELSTGRNEYRTEGK